MTDRAACATSTQQVYVSCHSVITPHAGFVEYTLKHRSLSGWFFSCRRSLKWPGQSMQLKKAAQLITGIKHGVLPILRRFENHLQVGQNALS